MSDTLDLTLLFELEQPEFGPFLRAAREARGLTRTSLSRLMKGSYGGSSPTRRWEEGKCRPRASTRVAIARALGMTEKERLDYAERALQARKLRHAVHALGIPLSRLPHNRDVTSVNIMDWYSQRLYRASVIEKVEHHLLAVLGEELARQRGEDPVPQGLSSSVVDDMMFHIKQGQEWLRLARQAQSGKDYAKALHNLIYELTKASGIAANSLKKEDEEQHI